MTFKGRYSSEDGDATHDGTPNLGNSCNSFTSKCFLRLYVVIRYDSSLSRRKRTKAGPARHKTGQTGKGQAMEGALNWM